MPRDHLRAQPLATPNGTSRATLRASSTWSLVSMTASTSFPRLRHRVLLRHQTARRGAAGVNLCADERDAPFKLADLSLPITDHRHYRRDVIAT